MLQVHAPAAGIKADAPVVGLVLQKSHINTKDECHYVALVAELEARGAKVLKSWLIRSPCKHFAITLCTFFRRAHVLAANRSKLECSHQGPGMFFVLFFLLPFFKVQRRFYCVSAASL